MSTQLGSPEQRERLERAVEAAEERSAIECVVMLTPRAGDYRFQALAGGAAAAFAWLLGVVYVPTPIPEAWALLATACVGLGGTVLASRSRTWLQLLVPRRERRAWVERLARALFVEQAMTGTRDRSGLLLVYAADEGELVLVPDVGIRRAAPPGALAEIERGFQESDAPVTARLEAALQLAGELLAEGLPRRPDDTDELPNEVRVLTPGPLGGTSVAQP